MQLSKFVKSYNSPSLKPDCDIPVSLHEFISSQYFNSFQESKLGNDLFVNDPERANRIYEAAEYGGDGSTRYERLEDMKEALSCAQQDKLWYTPLCRLGFNGDLAESIQESIAEYIYSEIEEVEAFHEKEGTIHNEVG